MGHYDDYDRICELAKILENEINRLKESGFTNETEDFLYHMAVTNLGNDDGRFDGFFTCLYCDSVYHQDYSSNSDPDRDFCDMEHEYAWLQENPKEKYNGELYEDTSLFPSKKIRNRKGNFWRKRNVFRIGKIEE